MATSVQFCVFMDFRTHMIIFPYNFHGLIFITETVMLIFSKWMQLYMHFNHVNWNLMTIFPRYLVHKNVQFLHLIKHDTMNTWGNGGVAPRILHLRTSCG